MKIALAQFAPRLGDPAWNRETVARLAARARGADLLVFPELSNSGYNFASREEAAGAAESSVDGPFLRHLVGLSREHRVFLAAGLCEQADGRLYNAALLVGPQGRIGHYRKMHLFWNEKDIFTPGDLGLPVFDLDLSLLGPDRGAEICRTGLLICFDWQFPEAWRVLALRGAEVVAHPSNLVLPGKAQRAVPALAMLNRVFALLANRTGRERELLFTGSSLIASPAGEVLAQATPEGEEILMVEADLAEARNKQVTPRNDLLRDRRPEEYALLAAPLPPGEDAP
jgi:predicted amidohydrolase